MNTFENIIITGRPASGKSELIDFLKKVPVSERIEKFHIGEFKELDDFLWVWGLGETDDLFEKMGRERIYTKNVGYGYVTKDPDLTLNKFMSLKMNRELVSNYLGNDKFYKNNTLFIEFARGGKNTYRDTLNTFDERALQETAIFFLNNSFEESIRRNDARYEAKKKHSILAHKCPDEEMQGIYKTNDWLELTDNKPNGYLNIKNTKIAFVTVANEPEVTDPKLIEERFSPPLKKLWELYCNR